MLFQSQYFHFYSHIPCGMWRIRLYLHLCCRLDFYSHIPCGMWRTSSGATNGNFLFLLTHPVWDVTLRESVTMFFIAFLLTHPVWDVTSVNPVDLLARAISTHTSRVGCDKVRWIYYRPVMISTHTSRVGCDSHRRKNTVRCIISTHTSRVGCDICGM